MTRIQKHLLPMSLQCHVEDSFTQDSMHAFFLIFLIAVEDYLLIFVLL